MRIGIDARCLQERQGSGVAVFTRELLRAMFREPREHSFVLFANALHQNASVLEEFSAPHVTIRSFRVPNKLLHASEALLRWPTLDGLMGNVDVVYMPNIHFASFSSRVPVVMTFFDMSYESHSDLFSTRSRLWHWVVNPRRLANRANAIVTISHHSKATIEQYFGVSGEKIHVVYPGAPSRQDETARGKSESHVRSILVLSDLEPRKNILSILRAFEGVKKTFPEPLRCIVVGRNGWNASYVKKLHDAARGISDVEFRGYVSESEKWNLLRSASALVYVSYEEGFGFPPLEAMSVGTPVVASSLASLPEVVGDAALLVNPYDIADIAKGLQAILSDDALRARLCERGYERITNYSWDAAARKALDIFAHLSL